MSEGLLAAPFAGTVLPLREVPDPVFSQGMVGGGAAIDPEVDAEIIQVLSPVEGRLVKVHPHAFIVLHPSGRGVLVHLGIDTVGLKGQGFTVHVEEGQTVTAGDLLIEADIALIRGKGLSAVCPVVLLDTPADSVSTERLGESIRAGETLFALPNV